MSLLYFRFRQPHLGRYPMERIKRVGEPTSRIDADQVPRVPLRGSFYNRPKYGDLGRRAQEECERFITKTPLSAAMDEMMATLMPYQEGTRADDAAPVTGDCFRMTYHLKSLCYFLDVDIVGVCEVPDYAWYSHDAVGEPIEPRHRYALVMVIDQGYETMEGSSGDDWMAGIAASRAYLKGQTAGNIVADYIRRLGFEARCHSAKDGQVQHIPLMLLAGIGELCRIGEVVMNPFIGPRGKPTIVTTDLPLIPDKPIDFGMQQFCAQCFKCARECPCRAISFGDKVMFNGYEIWKPDVETCTKYRVNNQRGSGCARCMKTCPLNKIFRRGGPLLVRFAHWLSLRVTPLRRPLTALSVWLDDVLGMGNRIREQKWWLDFEYRKGKILGPRLANDRPIDATRPNPGSQRIPLYPAEDLPPPDHSHVFPTDRRRALEKGVSAARDAADN